MSTNAIIGLVVAVVVIGGGAWYFSTHPMAAPTGEEGAPGGTQATGNAVPESGTLAYGEILLMGGSRECDISLSTAGGPATGKLYVADQNVRSDITMTSSGMTIAAHMIRTGGFIYSWSDMVNQGVKIKESASGSAPGGTSGAGYDPSAAVSYSCKGWITDSSKFVVPTNVTFKDYTAASGSAGAAPATY